MSKILHNLTSGQSIYSELKYDGAKIMSSNFNSKAVVLLLLALCLLLLPLWESVIVLCFVVRYFMSILVLQSS